MMVLGNHDGVARQVHVRQHKDDPGDDCIPLTCLLSNDLRGIYIFPPLSVCPNLCYCPFPRYDICPCSITNSKYMMCRALTLS